ncbi:hypothetical protein QE152_g26424 [Popillia japonica]|uniref:Paired domain-containing protein n=1 Tax=Popillia japonica TaxID=7064 RepID=A0AAW1JX32_POPJA
MKLHNEGKVPCEIAQILTIGKSTVNDIINKFKTPGTLKDKCCPGRSRKTTNHVNKMIKRKAIADSYKFQSNDKMESWLVDVKRVRIPRPKFGSGSRCYPTEPPKDYTSYDEIRAEDMKIRTSLSSPAGLAKATEDLRRALQEKL